MLDNTLVIVASDHGEHLGDHVLFFHGCSLYRQFVGVPLVIVDSKRVPAGRVVVEPVSLRDIPATVIDVLGLAARLPFPGQVARSVLGRERTSGFVVWRAVAHGDAENRLVSRTRGASPPPKGR